jgi:hypothetical protein
MIRCLVWIALGCLAGCTSLATSVTEDLSAGLATAVVDNEDVAGVRDGAPAFLLLVDGLLARDPDSPGLLRTGARLNSAYAAAFVDDPARQALLTEKALGLGARALCREVKSSCEARSQPFAAFSAWVDRLGARHVETAYVFAAAWAGWIQARADDWDAIADLARPKALMAKIVSLDASFDRGGAELYLGVFETLLPPALGGRAEAGREHFERAIAVSEGRHLLAKVMLAERYARLVFDRELHDRLLAEVLATDPRFPGLTLSNLLAQEQARRLLDSADDYF